MSARERLKEAVDAMRNIRRMTAAEWERSYLNFNSSVVSQYEFLPSMEVKWDAKVQGMKTELQLRMAEMLLEVK